MFRIVTVKRSMIEAARFSCLSDVVRFVEELSCSHRPLLNGGAVVSQKDGKDFMFGDIWVDASGKVTKGDWQPMADFH